MFGAVIIGVFGFRLMRRFQDKARNIILSDCGSLTANPLVNIMTIFIEDNVLRRVGRIAQPF